MTNFHEETVPKSALKKWTFEGGQRCSIVKLENIALSINFTHNEQEEKIFWYLKYINCNFHKNPTRASISRQNQSGRVCGTLCLDSRKPMEGHFKGFNKVFILEFKIKDLIDPFCEAVGL